MNCGTERKAAGIADPVMRQPPVEPFSQLLADQGLVLARDKTTVLQINVGLVCNLACRHCHLEAGPARRELMSLDVATAVIDFARANTFAAIDITGGAPELNPVLPHLIECLSGLTPELILRSNLSLPSQGSSEPVLDLCAEKRVTIISSFPSLNRGQFESQRGKDVHDRLIENLQKLNAMGYGHAGTGLRLGLVSNPAGAFLPAGQSHVEKKFRHDLEKNWGIVFSNLYTFGNAPLGRFRQWLDRTGNYEGYMRKLRSSFNPCTLSGLMCRSLLSVSWDGYLYDCDFNQAANIPLGGRKRHISQLSGIPEEGSPIGVGDHCYACTAGSGFT